MTSTYAFTNDYRIDRAVDFINSLVDNKMYFFVGDYIDHSNTEIQLANNNIDSLFYNVFDKMIMGKLISTTAAMQGIRNIPYQSDIVYTQYDDTVDLTDENYYCIVNAGSYSHVYKCLYNNHGANSTVEPNFMHIEGANTIVYQTSDGYIWKYLYSLEDSTIASFGTSQFIPYIANNTVINEAVIGSINVIEVEGAGKLYNNYTAGTLLSDDIRVEPNIYQITNSTISTTTSYYTGCIMFLTDGDGVGQYATVSHSYSNSSGNYVVVETDFVISPSNGTKYEITPQCIVYNNGLTSDPCVARAIVNATSSNSIHHIEILHPGTDQFIVTANVIANAAVGVALQNQAVVRPILPPHGGHGSDPASELNASYVLLSITLANSESNTILTTNQFQQIGLIKNPIFANVELNITGATKFFDLGETVYNVNLVAYSTNGIINTTSTTITDNDATFDITFNEGDAICVSNGSLYQMSNVVSITNSTVIDIAANGFFDVSNAAIYVPTIHETLIVLSMYGDTVLNVSNTTGNVTVSTAVIGANSGAYATISEIDRNDVIKDFQTFIQLYKYIIVPIHGEFIAGETIVQGNETAVLHSVVANTTMYLSELTGQFTNTGSTIYGETSGAEAQITQAYIPELEIGRGTIQYIDNIEPVTRQADVTETFKICLEF